MGVLTSVFVSSTGTRACAIWGHLGAARALVPTTCVLCVDARLQLGAWTTLPVGGT